MSANANAAHTAGLSEDERVAVKERAAELKRQAGRSRGNRATLDELDVLSKIAEMGPSDRAMAERIHAIVTATFPEEKSYRPIFPRRHRRNAAAGMLSRRQVAG